MPSMFEVGKEYTFRVIEEKIMETNHKMEECGTLEFGGFRIGEHFMILKNPESNNQDVYSFVLTGWFESKGSVYKCVYHDE